MLESSEVAQASAAGHPANGLHIEADPAAKAETRNTASASCVPQRTLPNVVRRPAPPMFPLRAFFEGVLPGQPLPRLRIVDVGAMLLPGSEEVWMPLLHSDFCESVAGFEPNAQECSRLNEQPIFSGSGSSCTTKFLPYALGDGSSGQFRLCSAPMTSSMLEPNTPLLRRFIQLEEVCTVVSRTPTETKRLDDLLPELFGSIDYLKLDVQGYELAVLQGAETALRDVLVVHTEVEFVELYEKQPLFAEVDQFLRRAGFVFHRFCEIQGRPMKPLHFLSDPLAPISQQLWADAVYVRDMWELGNHSKEQLLKTACILHEVYHSYDVVHHILTKVDSAVAAKYLAQVMGTGR